MSRLLRLPWRVKVSSLIVMQCGQNLSEGYQGQRLRFGIAGLALALGLAVVLVQGDFPIWTRAFVFIPALLGAMGAFSGLYRTCPGVAKKGVRLTEAEGETPIADKTSRELANKISRQVYINAWVAAFVVTTTTFLV